MLTLIIKYLIEGLAVAIATLLVAKKGRVTYNEVVLLALSAGVTFLVLDLFAPSIAPGARQGAGFGIGASQVGFMEGFNTEEQLEHYVGGSLNEQEKKLQQMKKKQQGGADCPFAPIEDTFSVNHQQGSGLDNCLDNLGSQLSSVVQKAVVGAQEIGGTLQDVFAEAAQGISNAVANNQSDNGATGANNQSDNGANINANIEEPKCHAEPFQSGNDCLPAEVVNTINPGVVPLGPAPCCLTLDASSKCACPCESSYLGVKHTASDSRPMPFVENAPPVNSNTNEYKLVPGLYSKYIVQPGYNEGLSTYDTAMANTLSPLYWQSKNPIDGAYRQHYSANNHPPHSPESHVRQ